MMVRYRSVIKAITDILKVSNSVTEEQARLKYSNKSTDEQPDATESTNNDLADSETCTCTCTCGRKRKREERSNGRTCKKKKVS